MVVQTTDLDDIRQATAEYPEGLVEFDPKWWLEQEGNIALINENKDVSLFQRLIPSVVIGHYFYHSRGKDAVTAAKEMLKEIFTGPYQVEVVEGLSPLEKIGARWLSRKLGFKSYGVVETTSGPCEMVIMTKDEWRTLYG